VLAHLDEMGQAFKTELQPIQRDFHHSELELYTIEELVFNGLEGHRQVKSDQDSDQLVIGRREDSVQDF